MSNKKINKMIRFSFLQGDKTLQQVGDEFGYTRERIRQILLSFGIKAKPREKEKKRIQRMKEVRFLVDSIVPKEALKTFSMQKRNAKRRKIEWKLSFAEWIDIWMSSGKWELRGCKTPNHYVMARNGDEGAYEIGNVKIITVQQNSKDAREKERLVGAD